MKWPIPKEANSSSSFQLSSPSRVLAHSLLQIRAPMSLVCSEVSVKARSVSAVHIIIVGYPVLSRVHGFLSPEILSIFFLPVYD